jgi:hypothetical protein
MGNRAAASGFLRHNLFRDFYFSASISYSNLMVFNANRSMNSMFYGPAFGSGTASIYGTTDVINIDVALQNTENTRMTLNFVEELEVEEYNFVRFVSKIQVSEPSKTQEMAFAPVSPGGNNGPEIRFNLILDVTPQATIDLIMDPVSGDRISGFGRGNLQIQYGTRIPLRVLGSYEIEQGRYDFSYEQFFHRYFEIQEGSSVVFRGDPYTAELNIRAVYRVHANLEDLDRQLIENRISPRSIVPVECILLLNGPMNRPFIAFDLELSQVSEELQRQVKSYIRTDEMLVRQIVYLLVFSRFYTPPENMRDNQSGNDWSYLTSTLSTQISNMLRSLSSNIQVGTVFHQSNMGDQTSTEFELLLSSQLLNNRLIINGNFGYIDNPYINGNQNNPPLIGDFDLEYKLTKSGDIRLKGYNHYNYRNYYSITPEMTQGIGILFRKDFNSWMDLLRRRRTERGRIVNW